MNKNEIKIGYLTEVYPLLAAQYDEEKNQLKAENIYINLFYDERIFYWKCPTCTSEWPTPLYSRLKNDLGWRQQRCGLCIKGLSFPQIAIQIHFERIIPLLFPNTTI